MNRNRLQQLQVQYFNFCLELIGKIPFENINADELMQRAFLLRDNLEKEIIKSEMNCKNVCLEKIELEVQKLKQKAKIQ